MYRRPKFLEILHEIREQMSREADYDMDLFAEIVRSGKSSQFKVQSSKDGEQESPPIGKPLLTTIYGNRL